MYRAFRPIVVLTAALALTAPAVSLHAQAFPRTTPAAEKTAGTAVGAELVTHVFVLKHAAPNDMARVISAFVGEVQPIPNLKAVAWTGRKELLPAVQEAVARFDVPPPPSKTIEATFYLLVGSKETTQESTLPESLRPVATQLGDLFGIKNLSLRETLLLRTVDGAGGSAESALPGLAPDSPRPDELLVSFDKATILEPEGTRSVRLSRLAARVRNFSVIASGNPPQVSSLSTNWETSIEVKEGQKAVVGKGNISGTRDPQFLVVSIRIED